jgi:8-oxo-dGTP diphosphatase
MARAAPLSPPPPLQRGAYGIAFDGAGRVLLIRGASGRFYLPGGRLEPGESAKAALARELGEECGCTCTPLASLGAGEQPIFGGAVRLEAQYWLIELGSDIGGGDQDLCWLDPAAALARLHRQGDRAALERACAAPAGVDSGLAAR